MGLEGGLGRPLSSVLLRCWGRFLTFLDLFPVSSSSRFFSGWLAPSLLLAYDPYFSIHSKTVHIKVIDGEAYEKSKNYFIEMMGPRMVDMSFQKGVVPCPPH